MICIGTGLVHGCCVQPYNYNSVENNYKLSNRSFLSLRPYIHQYIQAQHEFFFDSFLQKRYTKLSMKIVKKTE